MENNMKTKVGIVGLCGQSIFMRINHFHKPEETLHASDVHQEVGGKGYNQAVAVKRLGGDPYFLGAVGNDTYGDNCCDYLTNQGIKHSIVKKPGKTALAVILRDKNGNNQVTVYPGNTLEEKDLSIFFKEGNDFDFLLLNQEIPPTVLNSVLEWAKKNKIKVILNPAPVTSFTSQIIQYAWLITPNWHEVRELFALNEVHHLDDLISVLPKLNFPRMVVTLGNEGALVLEEGKVHHLPAIKVKVVDTTGAGDVFNAALVVGLGEKMTLLEATKFALKASGLSVTKDYVMPSIPYREEIIK